MVKVTHISRILALLACMGLLVCAVAGCAPSASEEKSSDPAALNRSYMARVNQQMADLAEVLEGFQAAVGEGDAVAMQASQAQAGRIIEAVKSAEAPAMLEDVKQGYVTGLDQLQQALGSYVQLYNDAQAGWLDEAAFNDRLAQVQASYDAGVQALADADAAAVSVANAEPDDKAALGQSASSQAEQGQSQQLEQQAEPEAASAQPESSQEQ